jgi:hypothetical protein
MLCNEVLGQLVNSKKRYLSKCMAYILILCSIYSFSGADEVNNEVYIEGVGALSVGEEINHQKYGIGKIKMLEKTESGYIGIIVFESGEKPMLINKDYFLPNNDK